MKEKHISSIDISQAFVSLLVALTHWTISKAVHYSFHFTTLLFHWTIPYKLFWFFSYTETKPSKFSEQNTVKVIQRGNNVEEDDKKVRYTHSCSPELSFSFVKIW